MDIAFSQLPKSLSSSIEHNGDRYLYFGGTAYLGIPQHKEFIQHYIDGIRQFGLNNGTSRSNNVQLGIYDGAEIFAADKFAAEAALIASSGYLAAQLCIRELANFGNLLYAPGTHPALWIGPRPAINHSFENWSSEVANKINNSIKDKWVIVSNSMNNLLPELYDFSFIELIDLKKQVILLIDDSHGIGITNDGKGIYSTISKYKNVEVIVVASMAKALGVDAGLVLSSKKMIDKLKHSAIFLGASPPAAAGLYAFTKADLIYTTELAKLKANMLLLAKKLNGKADWDFVEDFPVYLSKNAELSNQLLQQRILISSFAYPEKDGAKINRIVLSSWHTKDEIAQLISAL